MTFRQMQSSCNISLQSTSYSNTYTFVVLDGLSAAKSSNKWFISLSHIAIIYYTAYEHICMHYSKQNTPSHVWHILIRQKLSFKHYILARSYWWAASCLFVSLVTFGCAALALSENVFLFQKIRIILYIYIYVFIWHTAVVCASVNARLYCVRDGQR